MKPPLWRHRLRQKRTYSSLDAFEIRAQNRTMNRARCGWLILSAVMLGIDSRAAEKVAKPGVKAVQIPITEMTPTATFELGGNPDWMVVGDETVWISVSRQKAV